MASALNFISSAVSPQQHQFESLDPVTHSHSDRVATYCLAIATEMHLNSRELECVRLAALLHDVGKIGTDFRILEKPGPLTDDEFTAVKRHPSHGARMVRAFADLKIAIPGIELHHERLDGSGYPYGLAGDQIPLAPRIIAVADTFDAITSVRPYQKAMKLEFALHRVRSLAVSKLDPRAVAALERAVRLRRVSVAGEPELHSLPN